ncbi:hypothetical protein [Chryseobacterium sp.]|uniref:hypothetical protein n=1 Tax=Chryseobacterium sp. TaxID=1871047 RepID=UPI0035C6BABC
MREVFCDREVLQGIDQIKKEITLKEDENNQKIIIGGIPDNAILLKLDVDKKEYKQKSFYLKRGKDFIHKGCDYVLILPDFKKIILLELKSAKPKEKRYVDQFRASEIFMNYCNSLNSYINNSTIEYEFHRILFSYKNNNTTSSGIIDLTTKDQNNNEIVIKSPGFPNRIKLQKLVKIT